MTEPARAFILGLDLGQAADSTALAVLERFAPDPDPDAARGTTYRIQRLVRYPLHTPYPEIAADVQAVMLEFEEQDATLCVDATGVGAPVIDLLRGAGLSPVPITITGGQAATVESGHHHVPKYELIAAAVVLMQSGRLKMSRKLRNAGTLVHELTSFQRKLVNAASGGHETFEARSGKHDDLVLAMSLACWYGEAHPPVKVWVAGGVPFGPDREDGKIVSSADPVAAQEWVARHYPSFWR